MNLKMKPSLNAVCALTVFLPAICSTGLQGKVFRSKRQTDEHLGGPNTHTDLVHKPKFLLCQPLPIQSIPGKKLSSPRRFSFSCTKHFQFRWHCTHFHSIIIQPLHRGYFSGSFLGIAVRWLSPGCGAETKLCP